MVEVFLGSGIGGIIRYLIGLVSQKFFSQSWPGTLAVNVFGSILIVFLLHRFELRDQKMTRLIVVGFLGGFTTFSSFSYDIFQSINQGNLNSALIIFSSNILLGIVMGILVFR